MLTDAELDAIEARANAATAGEWCPCAEGDHCSAVTAGHVVISLAVTKGTVHANARTRSDGEFIANAREDVPALVREVRRLKNLVDSAAATIHGEFCGDGDDHRDVCPWALGQGTRAHEPDDAWSAGLDNPRKLAEDLVSSGAGRRPRSGRAPQPHQEVAGPPAR